MESFLFFSVTRPLFVGVNRYPLCLRVESFSHISVEAFLAPFKTHGVFLWCGMCSFCNTPSLRFLWLFACLQSPFFAGRTLGVFSRSPQKFFYGFFSWWSFRLVGAFPCPCPCLFFNTHKDSPRDSSQCLGKHWGLCSWWCWFCGECHPLFTCPVRVLSYILERWKWEFPEIATKGSRWVFALGAVYGSVELPYLSPPKSRTRGPFILHILNKGGIFVLFFSPWVFLVVYCLPDVKEGDFSHFIPLFLNR